MIPARRAASPVSDHGAADVSEWVSVPLPPAGSMFGAPPWVVWIFAVAARPGRPAVRGEALAWIRDNARTFHAAELRDARRAAGECVECGAPSGGALYCTRHAIRQSERRAAKRAARIAAGLCAECGLIPPAPGRRLCEHCNARDRAKYLKRKRRGSARR